MGTRGSNFERQSRHGLATHISQIRNVVVRVERHWFIADLPLLVAAQTANHMGQITGHHHLVSPGSKGSRRVCRSHHHAAFAHGPDEWCCTHHTAQRAVQTEFGNECIFLRHVGWQLFVGNQHRHSNRQIKTRATLALTTGGQVHRDSPIGPGKTARQKCGAHPIAAFAAYFVGLANDGEPGQPDTHMHLDIHAAADDTQQCGGTHRSKHHDLFSAILRNGAVTCEN